MTVKRGQGHDGECSPPTRWRRRDVVLNGGRTLAFTVTRANPRPRVELRAANDALTGTMRGGPVQATVPPAARREEGTARAAGSRRRSWSRRPRSWATPSRGAWRGPSNRRRCCAQRDDLDGRAGVRSGRGPARRTAASRRSAATLPAPKGAVMYDAKGKARRAGHHRRAQPRRDPRQRERVHEHRHVRSAHPGRDQLREPEHLPPARERRDGDDAPAARLLQRDRRAVRRDPQQVGATPDELFMTEARAP